MLSKTAALFTLACFVLRVAASLATSHSSVLARHLAQRNGALPGRDLRASTRASSLAKRADGFITRRSLDIDYAEAENIEGSHVVAATIHVDSKAPVLLLEEVEHLVESVECQPGSISVRVLPGAAYGARRDSWRDLYAAGYVVTSHQGCNADGERKLFKVKNVTVDEEASCISLEAEHAEWATSFSRFDVQIRRTQERHIHRRHNPPALRRQEEPTGTVSNLPTRSIPMPTATQTGEDIPLDISSSLINESMTLPGQIGSNINITCRNCSTFGTLDFDFVGFSFRDGLGNEEEGLQLGDVFEGGEARLVANGLGARVELDFALSNQGGLDIPLFDVPAPYSLSIRGIGSAGLLYSSTIKFAYTLNGTLGFTTGFEMSVPDDSHIFIDMTEPGNSSVAGFGNTSVSQIPFRANVDVQAAQLSVALRHDIVLGFEFNINNLPDAALQASLYLELPKFNAGFAKRSGVDEECAALASSASENKDVAERVLREVLSIEADVGWNAGFAGEVDFVAKREFDEAFANGTFVDVGGQCLVFNGTTGSYTDAKAIVEEAREEEEEREAQTNDANEGGDGDEDGNGGQEGSAGELHAPGGIYMMMLAVMAALCSFL